MRKIISSSLALFLLFQIAAFFADAGALPKAKTELLESPSTSPNPITTTEEEEGEEESEGTTEETEQEDEDESRLNEELEKRLSPEGLKVWKAVEELSQKISSENSPNKTGIQREIEGQLKKLSDDDVRAVLNSTANAAIAQSPAPEMRAFYESIKKLSPKGKRVLVGAVLTAGLDQEDMAERVIRQLGPEDQQIIIQDVMEELAKSPEASPEQKAFSKALNQMSPEGKRLLFSLLFASAFDKNYSAAKAKIDKLGTGDRKILSDEMKPTAAKKSN